MKKIQLATTCITYVAITVLILACLSLLRVNRDLHDRLLALKAGTALPFVTSGILLDLSESLTKVEEHYQPHVSINRKLVLLMSEECSFSRKNMSKWQNLVHAIANVSDVEVMLITFDSEKSAASVLKECLDKKISYSVYKVKRSDYLMYRTGLSGTPSTLLLDNHNKPLLIQSGSLDQNATSIFIKELLSKERVAHSVFLLSGDSTQILPKGIREIRMNTRNN